MAKVLTYCLNMDDLVAQEEFSMSQPGVGLAPPSADQQLPIQQQQTKAVGRPVQSSAARAASDERYNKIAEFEKQMPSQAKDYRFAIYEAKRHLDHKVGHRPLESILASDWKELQLNDVEILKAYLIERYEPSRFLIEPQDAHKARIEKLASWVVSTYEDDDDMYDDEEYQPPRGRRGRGRRQRQRPYEQDYDEDEDLDTPTSRSGFMDGAAMASDANHAERRSMDDRREREETRRDDDRREQRREDKRIEEQRRYDEEKKAEEIRRADDRRYEERREDDRRRDDERRDTERRQDEERRAASDKKTEMMLAAIPLLQGIMSPKAPPDNPVMTLLLTKMMEKGNDADPVMIMLLKSVLDKGQGQDSMSTMISSMGEMSRMSSQSMAEQMKLMMSTSNDMNNTLMKSVLERAMAVTPGDGGDGEGQNMISQILEAVSGATGLISTLTGGDQQQQQPQPGAFPQQQVMPAGAPVQAPPNMGMVEQPQQPGQMQPLQQMEPQEFEEEVPNGISAVGGGLMAIQQGVHQSDEELQKYINFVIKNMTPELKQAVLAGDQMGVINICSPAFLENPTLKEWISADGVADWLLNYIPRLIPSIQAIDHANNEANAGVAPMEPMGGPIDGPMAAIDEVDTGEVLEPDEVVDPDEP